MRFVLHDGGTALEYRKGKLLLAPVAIGLVGLAVVAIGLALGSLVAAACGAPFVLAGAVMVPGALQRSRSGEPALARYGELPIGADVPAPAPAGDVRYGFVQVGSTWNAQIEGPTGLCSFAKDAERLPGGGPMTPEALGAALEALGVRPGLEVRGQPLRR